LRPPDRDGQRPANRETRDLPATIADLPAVVADNLPSHAGSPPAGRASLPVAAAGSPARGRSIRVTGPDPVVPSAGSRGFGEIELPVLADALPAVADALPRAVDALPRVADGLPSVADVLPVRVRGDRRLSTRPDPGDMAQAFGEIDLPREMPAIPEPSPRPMPAAQGPRSEARGLELGDSPPPRRSSGAIDAVARHESGGPVSARGGMTFGEVDLGGGGTEADTARSTEDGSATGDQAEPTSWKPPVATSAAPSQSSVRERPSRDQPRRRSSRGKLFALVGVTALLTGGAALQLTPYGAYAHLAVIDLVRAGDYARATARAVSESEASLGSDTYAAAKVAMASAYAAHGRVPRAKSLTAYAALVDSAASVRFGADTTRASRAKQLLAELPADRFMPYRDVATAAQIAEAGDLDRARKALAVARPLDPNDPVEVEVTLLLGDIELAAGNAPAALVDFKRALGRPDDARAHFGLARAYDGLGDAANAKKEIDATLALSPRHVGALTLRARRQSASVEPARALEDLAVVLDGPVQALASPSELSDAYAARAWVQLERGEATEARDSFARAVSINPSNVDALNGEGRLLLDEGRYAEALARLDKALDLAPNSPQTIASDAEAKLELERLSDARQQLVAAREKFPRSIPILLLLAKVEEHSGNDDGAEAYLHIAIADADPLRPEAVLPFLALCELNAARGRLNDARSTLEEAKKTLAPSSALERAFGEFDERQGAFDAAIGHYRSAIAKDSRDVAARFRLAVALRRARRFDEASAELDRVFAVDRDYPGLLLERGLLFEDSGDVDRAIDQFKAALAKAPDDADLELRVGAAYVAIGRPEDALPMLRKVLDKRPASAEANHYIGRALMLQGGSQSEAIGYLKRAVELDPNRAEFHVYLAWAANDVTPAQLDLARDEIDRALAIDKLNAEAYWQRGVLERMEGAIDDAVADEKHALELRPTRSEAHATLAECYEDKNDDPRALAEWPRAIAGDATGSPGGPAVAHPYWRYRYGKLLLERGNGAAALAQLIPAVTTAEKLESRPGWLAPLEFLTAEALRGAGRRSEAVDHYRRFLDIAPVNSPDRYDAQRTLAQLAGKR
jgi:tetratricopeptide (TPR) repeat protein